VRSGVIWAAVAFLSELAALAALAYWGATVADSTVARVLLGVGLPAVAIVLWGLFAAPRAVVRRIPLVVATKILVFGAAVLALAGTGHLVLAVVLAACALLGSFLSPGPEGLRPGS
jgi:hypothetical protein